MIGSFSQREATGLADAPGASWLRRRSGSALWQRRPSDCRQVGQLILVFSRLFSGHPPAWRPRQCPRHRPARQAGPPSWRVCGRPFRALFASCVQRSGRQQFFTALWVSVSLTADSCATSRPSFAAAARVSGCVLPRMSGPIEVVVEWPGQAERDDAIGEAVAAAATSTSTSVALQISCKCGQQDGSDTRRMLEQRKKEERKKKEEKTVCAFKSLLQFRYLLSGACEFLVLLSC
jgi:hypothetical protein